MNTLARSNNFSALDRQVFRFILCILLLPLCSFAQQNKLIVKPGKTITAKRGATVVESMDVTVLPGFHVNSDKPKDEFLIPLKLTWNPGPLQPTSVSYPKPEEIKVGNQMLAVFTGSFDVKTEFKTLPHAPVGPATMTGKLRYQACNSEMCFRPSTVDVTLPIVIEAQ